MSGFVVIFNRDGSTVSPEVLERSMSSLDHRGPHGYRSVILSHVGLGHHHFWTTPEEVGEAQPLIDDRFAVLLDGRIDNRDDLTAMLGSGVHDDQISDAALVLLLYDRFGESCIEQLLGAFALVFYDRDRQEVICVRDALGDRTMFYHISDDLFVAASESRAVVEHPDISDELDEVSLAQFYAVEYPGAGRSMFSAVSELMPAHVLKVGREESQQRRYWEANPRADLRYRSDEQYVKRFRELLELSVRSRMRAPRAPGVMMSGGFDSTSVAAIAATQLRQANSPQGLTTISYVFDEFAECDERRYIDPLNDKFQTNPIHIVGDELWPLKEWSTLPVNFSSPDCNPYRVLKDSVYRSAQDTGVSVLLTGTFGDHLYTGREFWLVSLFEDGRYSQAAKGLRTYLRDTGLSEALRSSTFRQTRNSLAGKLVDVDRIRARRKRSNRKHWLTPYAESLLPGSERWPLSAPAADRPGQHWSVLGTSAAFSSSGEIFFASRFDVELRHPYRDRRLVDFMLSIPAHQFYSQGQTKYILRKALADLLPREILERKRPTSLGPLFLRGFLDREAKAVNELLASTESIWSRFVRSEWLQRAISESLPKLSEKNDGVEMVVPWYCVTMELWRSGIMKAIHGSRLQTA